MNIDRWESLWLAMRPDDLRLSAMEINFPENANGRDANRLDFGEQDSAVLVIAGRRNRRGCAAAFIPGHRRPVRTVTCSMALWIVSCVDSRRGSGHSTSQRRGFSGAHPRQVRPGTGFARAAALAGRVSEHREASPSMLPAVGEVGQ